jgi:hypothetical protein
MDAFPFSQYLFWDSDIADIDLQRNKGYIIERVLTRGELSDFKSMLKLYSNQEIAESIIKSKQLDAKTAHFCSWYFKIPINRLHVSSFYR